jgi:hypothetical protein
MSEQRFDPDSRVDVIVDTVRLLENWIFRPEVQADARAAIEIIRAAEAVVREAVRMTSDDLSDYVAALERLVLAITTRGGG